MTKSIWIILVCCLVLPKFVSGQTATLSVTGGEGFVDSTVIATVNLVTDGAVHGFSLGLNHDPTILSIPTTDHVRSGTLLAVLNSGTGPDFFEVNIAPENGTGFTVGCVTDLLPPFDFIPPVTTATPILEVDYLIDAAAAPSTVTLIDFSDLLGTPPVQTVMVFDLQEVIPVTTGGSITVTEPLFIRGDLDQSGGLSLIDGILVLYRVLALEPPGPCADAEDVNDDGSKDILDAIFLFQYLFINGPTIPGPHGTCGPDPTSGGDPHDCVEYPACG